MVLSGLLLLGECLYHKVRPVLFGNKLKSGYIEFVWLESLPTPPLRGARGR